MGLWPFLRALITTTLRLTTITISGRDYCLHINLFHWRGCVGDSVLPKHLQVVPPIKTARGRGETPIVAQVVQVSPQAEEH